MAKRQMTVTPSFDVEIDMDETNAHNVRKVIQAGFIKWLYDEISDQDILGAMAEDNRKQAMVSLSPFAKGLMELMND